MTNKNSSSWICQVAASICCLWLMGCGGGSSSSVKAVSTYEGGGGGIKGLPAAEVVLQTFSNNTLTGTMTVTKAVGALTADPLRRAALPSGQYQFSATVTGNNFSGQGTYLGSPALNFTVEGVFPTDRRIGIITIKGSTAAGQFNYDLGIHKTTGPIGQDGNFSFSNLQNSNATATNLTNTVNWSSGLPTALARHATIGFYASPSSSIARTLSVSLSKAGEPFVAGDVLPIGPFTTQDPLTSLVYYTEGTTDVKLWNPVSGSVKILDIQGLKVTVELVNVRMEPAPIIPGRPNSGTGEFTINGRGTATIMTNPIPTTPNTF